MISSSIEWTTLTCRIGRQGRFGLRNASSPRNHARRRRIRRMLVRDKITR